MRLEEAIATFRETLKEWTREREPLDWARAQNNLSNALIQLGVREGGTAQLEEALVASRMALEERSRERVPLDWATTQITRQRASCAGKLGTRPSATA